jgi:hypothetical protein
MEADAKLQFDIESSRKGKTIGLCRQGLAPSVLKAVLLIVLIPLVYPPTDGSVAVKLAQLEWGFSTSLPGNHLVLMGSSFPEREDEAHKANRRNNKPPRTCIRVRQKYSEYVHIQREKEHPKCNNSGGI